MKRRRRVGLLLLAATALVGLAVASWLWLPALRAHQPADAGQVRAGLDELAAGGGDWATFSVTYDDTHGFHGGYALTFCGDGRVEYRTDADGLTITCQVDRPALDEIVALLREVRAWEQWTPERAAVPDESTARLTTRSAGHEATVWEWYNELAANSRIARVRDLMSRLARKAEASR